MENFNNPYIDKLVGLNNEQKDLEQTWHEYVINRVEIIGGKQIESFEVSKTEKDIQLINYVQNEANNVLRKYGRVKMVTALIDNIHILREGGTNEFTEGRLTTGAHSSIQKSILIDRMPSDIQFCLVLFHEMLHLKSYSALQVSSEGNSVRAYRSGISVTSRDGKTVYLKSVEEAVIGYLTNNFYETVLATSRFKDEGAAEKITIGRQPEIEQLNKVVLAIFEKNKGQFSNTQEVLHIFIDAQINGNLHRLSKLVANTFELSHLKEIDFK